MSTVDLSLDANIPPCPCNGQLAAADPRYRFQYVDWFRYCFGYNIPQALNDGITVNQVRWVLGTELSVIVTNSHTMCLLTDIGLLSPNIISIL
jgi:hypothetical protein